MSDIKQQMEDRHVQAIIDKAEADVERGVIDRPHPRVFTNNTPKEKVDREIYDQAQDTARATRRS